MCIDICPVGALTSGTYRYKTRPWEMNHVGTVCTHCGDGCKTTLGVRPPTMAWRSSAATTATRAASTATFLCIKGRYAFDFANHKERLTKPLIRQADGKLAPVSWEQALDFAAKKLGEIRDSRGGNAIGVIGSNRTTNEEAYLLQKFARTVLRTNNIDHHRTADYAAFAAALKGHAGREASLRDFLSAPAILLLGNDPTNQHPALAWQVRTNVRLNRARLYVANHADIKLRRQAKAAVELPADGYASFVEYLAGNDGAFEANDTTRLSATRSARKNRCSSSSVRSSVDAISRPSSNLASRCPIRSLPASATTPIRAARPTWGCCPICFPATCRSRPPAHFAEEYGSALPTQPGLDLVQMLDAAGRGDLSALYVVGSNPVARYGIDPSALKNTFLIVQDMFLTETAVLADVVFPAANLYEKSGTVTNTYGDLQLVKKAADKAGVRTDFEIIVRLADKLGADPKQLVPFGKGVRADFGQTRGAQSGEADRHAVWLSANHLEPKLSPFDPFAILDEIQRLVPAYDVPRLNLLTGNDEHLKSELVQIDASDRPARSRSALERRALYLGHAGQIQRQAQEVVESHTILMKPAEAAAD